MPPATTPTTPTTRGAANAGAFSQPHWRVIAAGFDTERWFNDVPTRHVAVRQLYVPGLFIKGQHEPPYEAMFAQPVELTTLR